MLLVGPVTAVIEEITSIGCVCTLILVVTVERMSNAVSHYYNIIGHQLRTVLPIDSHRTQLVVYK